MRNDQVNLGNKNAMSLIAPVSFQTGNGTLFFRCPTEQIDVQTKTYHYKTMDRDYILLGGVYYISHINEQ
jgi:hypothetical protein